MAESPVDPGLVLIWGPRSGSICPRGGKTGLLPTGGIPEGNTLTVTVQGENVDKALRTLKRRLQKEGVLKDMRSKRFYEKPSVKKKRKQKDAERKRRKALRVRSSRPF